jgi:predicted DNA binding CopG/RHH family protein
MKKLKKIPSFKTVESESAFWDASDLTDYFDFDNPQKVHIPAKKSVTLRIEPELLEGVKKVAACKRQYYQTMIREWIREKYLKEIKSVKS